MPTYRDASKYGDRCLISGLSYNEPYWETGKKHRWKFRRSDGTPCLLAGRCSTYLNFPNGSDLWAKKVHRCQVINSREIQGG